MTNNTQIAQSIADMQEWLETPPSNDVEKAFRQLVRRTVSNVFDATKKLDRAAARLREAMARIESDLAEDGMDAMINGAGVVQSMGSDVEQAAAQMKAAQDAVKDVRWTMHVAGILPLEWQARD